MIEPTDLIGLRLSSDRQFLRLRVRDETGKIFTVSLPIKWFNAMLNMLPRLSRPEPVYPLDSWSLDPVGNGKDLLLTLRTPEGQAFSFALKSWQVEGMATIATYGTSGQSPPTTMH